jgi:hypothetical protein
MLAGFTAIFAGIKWLITPRIQFRLEKTFDTLWYPHEFISVFPFALVIQAENLGPARSNIDDYSDSPW